MPDTHSAALRCEQRNREESQNQQVAHTKLNKSTCLKGQVLFKGQASKKEREKERAKVVVVADAGGLISCSALILAQDCAVCAEHNTIFACVSEHSSFKCARSVHAEKRTPSSERIVSSLVWLESAQRAEFRSLLLLLLLLSLMMTNVQIGHESARTIL